jgi:hypothetical protein
MKENSSLVSLDIAANVNKMEIQNLSWFTDNIRYVSLQTSGDNYHSWISYCALSGDYMLITNLKECFLFNTEGKYIKKIGSVGRGPGEYDFALSVGFDSDTNIYIQSLYDLLEYRKDGSFVKKDKNFFILNDSLDEYFQNWIIVNDSLFFGLIQNTTGLVNDKALLKNKNHKIIKSFTNYILFKRSSSISDIGEAENIYKFKNRIYYKEKYNDTLFCLDENFGMIPKYTFRLDKFKQPLSERVRLDNEIKYIFVNCVFQTENYLFLDCGFGDQFPAKRLTPEIIPLPNGEVFTRWYNTHKVLGIFNKKTKNLIFCKPTSTDNRLYTTGLYNDFDSGPRFFPWKQVNDSTLAMWIEAKRLKEHVASDDFKNNVPKYPEKKKELEKLANSLSELDNPVLMFVTFKNR